MGKDRVFTTSPTLFACFDAQCKQSASGARRSLTSRCVVARTNSRTLKTHGGRRLDMMSINPVGKCILMSSVALSGSDVVNGAPGRNLVVQSDSTLPTYHHTCKITYTFSRQSVNREQTDENVLE